MADQPGAFASMIDEIVFVLNSFAIIDLLAAGLGIVHTLHTSTPRRVIAI